jgi:hypothetical protein
MARIRSIKPEFWTSQQIVECSTNARLLFVGLWNFCDDNGIHHAETKRLKMEVFPGDDFTVGQITGWIGELLTVGLLREYEAEGRRYWLVTGWKKHQRIDKPSHKHPLPPATDSTNDQRGFVECSTNDQRGLDERSPPDVDVDVEGKGNISARAAHPDAPDGFNLFWIAYPKKRSKGDALKAWLKLSPNAELQKRIMEAVKEARASEDWTKESGKFIPYPASWLNAEGWEDEYTSSNKPASLFEGAL